MRINVIFIFIVFIGNFSSAQSIQSFIVKGTIKNATGKPLILRNFFSFENAEEILEEEDTIGHTILSRTGVFEFKFTAAEQNLYTLTVGNNEDILFINNKKNIYIDAAMHNDKAILNPTLLKKNEFKAIKLNQELDKIFDTKNLSDEIIKEKSKNLLINYYKNTSDPALHLYILGLNILTESFDKNTFQQLLTESIKKFPDYKGLKLFQEYIQKRIKKYRTL